MEETSHKIALKSTGIIGGAQVVTILIGIAKTKLIAVLLGPSGVGIAGLLQTIIDLTRNLTGFGINFSGVKDIAEAHNSSDEQRISKTITIVRSWAKYTGFLGMIIVLTLCVPLSHYSFGDNSYALSIAILSVILLISSISAAQIALLQGLRQMRQMAKATIFGSASGLIITIPLYFWLGVKGIVPAMLLTSVTSLFISWYLVRNISVLKIKLTIKEIFSDGLGMAKLGFFIVIQGSISTLTMYIVRNFVAGKVGVEGVGIFQAAFNISTVYLGVILNAMLADFYPRLSAVSQNDEIVKRLTNEQGEVALFLGVPMIVGFMVFISIIIKLLYSSAFLAAIPILMWQLVNGFFTLLAWPPGTIFLAKGKGMYLPIYEGLWSLFYIAIIYFGWQYFTLEILGIASLIAGFIRLIVVYLLVVKLFNFRWSFSIKKDIAIYALMVLSSLFILIYRKGQWQLIFGIVVFLLCGIYSYFKLRRIINFREVTYAVFNRFVRK
jgi:O-antigen/teichoic acid export membrane protein